MVQRDSTEAGVGQRAEGLCFAKVHEGTRVEKKSRYDEKAEDESVDVS